MMEPTFGLNWALILTVLGAVVALMVLVGGGALLALVARRRRSADTSGEAADTALEAHQRMARIQSQVERLEDVLMDELKKE